MKSERFIAEYRQRRSYAFELRRQGQLETALQEIESMLAEGADTGELRVDQADVLGRLGRTAEALEGLEQARLDFALSPYGRTVLGGLLEKAGRRQEAAEIFESLALEPRLDPASLRRVSRHFLQSRQPERAVALMRRLGGDTPGATQELAKALQEAGHGDEALAELERGVATWPDDEALFDALARLRLAGQPAEVVVEEFEVLLSMPARAGSVRLRSTFARSLRAAGHLERARDQFLEILERAPGDVFNLSHLAHVYRGLKQPERAADVMEQVLERTPLDQIARNTYFAACREAGLADRARAYVALKAASDPRLKIYWNDLRKAFKKG